MKPWAKIYRSYSNCCSWIFVTAVKSLTDTYIFNGHHFLHFCLLWQLLTKPPGVNVNSKFLGLKFLIITVSVTEPGYPLWSILTVQNNCDVYSWLQCMSIINNSLQIASFLSSKSKTQNFQASCSRVYLASYFASWLYLQPTRSKR